MAFIYASFASSQQRIALAFGTLSGSGLAAQSSSQSCKRRKEVRRCQSDASKQVSRVTFCQPVVRVFGNAALAFDVTHGILLVHRHCRLIRGWKQDLGFHEPSDCIHVRGDNDWVAVRALN